MGTPDNINRLRTGAIVALIAALPVAIGLSHDLLRPYTVTPDADLIYLGQALRLGDGLSQTYHDHTGHAYILMLYVWLEFWSFLGATPSPSQSLAIASADIDGYIQPLVVAGRGLSMAISALFTLMVMAGARAMGMPRTLVLATGLIFAVSQGVTAQAVIMRAEMASALGIAACFFALVQSQRSHGRAHLAWLVLAGASAVLSLDAKVQAIIPLFGLPALTLAMGPFRKPRPLETVTIDTVIFAVFALALGVALMTVLTLSFALSDLAGPYRGYQVLIVLYLAACMAGYGFLYREPAWRQFTGALAVLAGLAIGTGFLFIWYSQRLLDALVHFVEHMTVFSSVVVRDGLSGDLMLDLIPHTIERRAENILNPTGILEFLALGIVAVLLRRGEWRRAVLMLMMLGLAIAVETVFGLRGFRPSYRIYVELWVFLAVGIGLTPLLAWQSFRTNVVFTGIALGFAGWIAVLSLQDDMVPRQRLQNVCDQANTYLDPALAERFSGYCGAGQKSINSGRNSSI